jgi:ABC-2 type transport system ATP-binding protein
MEIAIKAEHLSKEYPGRTALSDFSFVVKKGTIHGFLGPNGAGKTTTMKILTGLISPTSGNYQINGKIGFLPENPPLYQEMLVEDYLKFVLSIYSNEKFNPDLIERALKLCGLENVRHRLIGNLSKGFKQKVGIAGAIVHMPEVIILDEPTVGLDPVAIVEIRNLIKSLKGEHTILFSSHQLHEVELLCEEITLIGQGHLLISGNIETISQSLMTKKHFKARVNTISESDINQLKSKFSIDEIAVENDSQGIPKIEIFTGNQFNEKTELFLLTAFLANVEIGLLEFVEEKLDLEQIFSRITSRGEK